MESFCQVQTNIDDVLRERGDIVGIYSFGTYLTLKARLVSEETTVHSLLQLKININCNTQNQHPFTE